MSKSQFKSAFEERADRLQRVETRRQREFEEFLGHYDDAFTSDDGALSADEFWNGDCADCEATRGGGLRCARLCEDLDEEG
ncbi:hypothetical protein ACH4YO_08075 [Streptomyces noursei]|uniref:hypothetical protein n=1 Tax=Streptomyces noursei TaxID=1971 RepID=UPI00340E3555